MRAGHVFSLVHGPQGGTTQHGEHANTTAEQQRQRQARQQQRPPWRPQRQNGPRALAADERAACAMQINEYMLARPSDL